MNDLLLNIIIKHNCEIHNCTDDHGQVYPECDQYNKWYCFARCYRSEDLSEKISDSILVNVIENEMETAIEDQKIFMERMFKVKWYQYLLHPILTIKILYKKIGKTCISVFHLCGF